jgi:hypothetical protein
MAAEAAVLGTPAIRFNDFVGEISYLKDLENYGLSYGIRSNNDQGLFTIANQLLSDLQETLARSKAARERLLRDKIDCADYFTRLLLTAVK